MACPPRTVATTSRGITAALAAALLASLAGCAGVARPPVADAPPVPAATTRAPEAPGDTGPPANRPDSHGLAAATVVDATTARQSPTDAFIARLARADAVLLGEQHYNPDHHRVELDILQALVDAGLRPALGLEVVPASRSATLMRYITAPPAEERRAALERRLRDALGWGGEDDRRWRAYGPLLRLAREYGLTVFGADLPGDLRLRIARSGTDTLSAAERRLLPDIASRRQPDAAYRDLMLERLRAAHCGHGSATYLQRLWLNWQLRNQAMAEQVAAAVAAGDGQPVVLVTGIEHLRHGLGLAARLRELRPAARVINAGLRARTAGEFGVSRYLEQTVHGGRRFAAGHDWLVLTPAPGRTPEDHCREFMETRADSNPATGGQ